MPPDVAVPGVGRFPLMPFLHLSTYPAVMSLPNTSTVKLLAAVTFPGPQPFDSLPSTRLGRLPAEGTATTTNLEVRAAKVKLGTRRSPPRLATPSPPPILPLLPTWTDAASLISLLPPKKPLVTSTRPL